MDALTVRTLEPPYDSWTDLLKANQQQQATLDNVFGHQSRATIKEEIVQLACAHTKTVKNLARDIGVTLQGTECSSGTPARGPIIMSGHQPVLYHRGLAFKSETLSRFARESGGIGIHVVIDTDEGDGGAIAWPKVINDTLEIKRGSIVAEPPRGGTTFGIQRLASRDRIVELFEEIESDVRQSALSQVARRVRHMREVYAALADQPVSIAHSIARWSVNPSAHIEVLLSDLMTRTGLHDVIRELAKSGAQLVRAYNATLEEHRQEHRIENTANPFPNLKISEAGIELPFWVVEKGVRSALFLLPGEVLPSLSHGFYAPRGSITTLFLRGYCSDMFIHGLGGRRYDTFVDRFVRHYFNVELPKFVVASETQYLFPNEVKRIGREVEIALQFKEIVARTEKFFGQDIFSPEEERTLQLLIDSRNQLRAKIQQAQTEADRRPIAHALNEANRRVRDILEAGSLQAIRARASSNEAALTRWKFREFPFFMFEE
jgi:hypothetical protein